MFPSLCVSRADEMVLKSISYAASSDDALNDFNDVVQIWCSKTIDQLIGSFPNVVNHSSSHYEHFRLSNSLQNTDGTSVEKLNEKT